MKKYKWFIIIGIILTAVIIYLIYYFKLGTRAFKHFDYSEFDSPALPADKLNQAIQTYFNPIRGKDCITGSGERMMHVAFIQKLDLARDLAGVPFFITSGYRTPAYNNTLSNSVTDSAHTRGYAADIAAPPGTKERIIRALVKVGFNRIGEGSSFIHVDNDPAKPAFAYWTYGNSQTVFDPWNTNLA